MQLLQRKGNGNYYTKKEYVFFIKRKRSNCVSINMKKCEVAEIKHIAMFPVACWVSAGTAQQGLQFSRACLLYVTNALV